MISRTRRKLHKFITKYRVSIISIGLFISLSCIAGALLIYSSVSVDGNVSLFYEKLGDFILSIGETILVAGLIVGGINFVLEELRKEEEEAKEAVKNYLEEKEKRKQFRMEMQNSLREVHDKVELARVLIKSHQSGRTYGDQLRNRIMPSLIFLQDLRRKLDQEEDPRLMKNLQYLRVSLHYMIAYLSVLVEEFEANYLRISNLQTYQDALTNKMRMVFTDLRGMKEIGAMDNEQKQALFDQASQIFDSLDVPANIGVVWKAMQELKYIRDFIGQLRDQQGARNIHNQYFIRHYNHCIRILGTGNSEIDPNITNQKDFQFAVQELERIDEKRKADLPLVKGDNLTKIIMDQLLKLDLRD